MNRNNTKIPTRTKAISNKHQQDLLIIIAMDIGIAHIHILFTPKKRI